jgi:adenylate cyclase class 2
MPVEIEAKLKVNDLNPVRASLKEKGGALVGDFLETNTFFDTEDRSLLAADEGLRLRRNRNAATNVDEFILTYKGPRQHGPLKSRDEQELVVGSETEAIRLLECLGYAVVLKFEKRRQSWKLDDCKVELDELPYLGAYVEIEGPTEQSVMRVRERLGLMDRAIVRASYVALLLTHLQEQGELARVITFPSGAFVARAG